MNTILLHLGQGINVSAASWTTIHRNTLMIINGKHIPPSRVTTCSGCGCYVDTEGFGTWQLSTGWVPCKRRGKSQAINQLIHADRHFTFRCEDCFERLKAGIPDGQMTIFDAMISPNDEGRPYDGNR